MYSLIANWSFNIDLERLYANARAKSKDTWITYIPDLKELSFHEKKKKQMITKTTWECD